MSEDVVYMPCAEAEKFAYATFRAAGVPEKDARLCAEVLIAADRRGVSSHGIGRITGHYLNRVRIGIQKAVTEIEFVRKSGATCVIDGHHGMGMVIAAAAMRFAIDRARVISLICLKIKSSLMLVTKVMLIRYYPVVL